MSITRTKARLGEAISLYEQLSQEIKDTNNAAIMTDEQWASYIRTLGHDAARLIQTSRSMDNDHLMRVLLNKQRKLERHKAWKKRSRKRVKHEQRLVEKRNKQWIKEIEWKVTTAKVQKDTKDQKERETRTKIKELSRLLTKLTELRNLRRKKLESQGHFFADDGNEFFNKVKEWHEQQEKGEPERKELIIDEQDHWKHMELDKTAYEYWCQANQSTSALLRIRKEWDQYIWKNHERDDSDPVGKIPPTFVKPSPPANWVWATYLL